MEFDMQTYFSKEERKINATMQRLKAEMLKRNSDMSR